MVGNMLSIGLIIKERRVWYGEQRGGAESQVSGWVEGRLVWVLSTLPIFFLHKEKKWFRWGGVGSGAQEGPYSSSFFHPETLSFVPLLAKIVLNIEFCWLKEECQRFENC